MVDSGLDSELFQQGNAAHAQQDFLADAEVPVAHIEVVRDLAVVSGVPGHVRVKQVELYGAHADAPHLGKKPPVAKLHADFKGIAGGRAHLFHGQVYGLVELIVGNLPAVLVYGLVKVAVAVEKADCDQGNIEIRGAFQVIAGEDAQAARVDGEGLVQAVFR